MGTYFVAPTLLKAKVKGSGEGPKENRPGREGARKILMPARSPGAPNRIVNRWRHLVRALFAG
jgi:hypothetical protein